MHYEDAIRKELLNFKKYKNNDDWKCPWTLSMGTFFVSWLKTWECAMYIFVLWNETSSTEIEAVLKCVILTLPLELPPTVVGYLLLRVLGPKRIIGSWSLTIFGIKLTMAWWSAIFATTMVIFPLMYRMAWGAFESFDETLAHAGQTFGLSNTYIFLRIRMPFCKQGILAGTFHCNRYKLSLKSWHMKLVYIELQWDLFVTIWKDLME